jgi:hypothetical protein
MATPGLSLVGFLDQQAAINNFRNAYVPLNPSDAALTSEWTTARNQLGAPLPNAGHPTITPIPPAQQGHVQALQRAPWAQAALQGPLLGVQFQLVEIEPLLAFQIAIDTDRCAHHCNALPQPPGLDQLMDLCLPLTPQNESFQAFPCGQNAMLVKARSLNVRTLGAGLFNAQFMGIQFGPSLPFVHVVRHNGRCYLHNGFHRAYGARMAGATHVPCLFRDVPDHASVGIREDGSTFGTTLLESANPPTLGHFAQGRAYAVQIRSVSRVLHVSWSDYAIPDE